MTGGSVRRWRGGTAGSVLALAVATPAAAQVGQVTPPTRADVERAPVPQRALPPSRLSISGGIERAPCPLAGPRFAGITVTLTEVVFDDPTTVDPATLRPAYAPFLGQTVPIATVCEIRDAAATLLRRQGYLAAVQVPAQRIEGGTLHLSVLMARLVAVHVLGDVGHAERRIAAYLEPLATGQPFNSKVAERALLLAGDLPGFEVNLTLRAAGTAPGEVVGDVTVTRIPVAIDLNVQDYGSRAVGRWSGLVGAEANDLLGLGDRLALSAYNTFDTHEQTALQGSYEVRPDASGAIVSVRGTYAWTRPSTGNGDPIRARTLIATAEAAYPVIRRQQLTLRLAGGLDVVRQRLRFGGLPLTEDQLRIAYARADLAIQQPVAIAGSGVGSTEPRWRAALALELRQGLAGLGASRRCGPAPVFAGCTAIPSISRLDADPQATVARLSGTASYAVTPRLTLVVSPRAQLASGALLSFEQFSAGNYTIGRGYDPGSLNGDEGLGTQVEARVGPFRPRRDANLFVQPFAFVDYAGIRTLGALPSVYRRERLVSVGGGVRASLPGRALAELFLAAPVGETQLAGQRRPLRVLLSLSAHFTPGH